MCFAASYAFCDKKKTLMSIYQSNSNNSVIENMLIYRHVCQFSTKSLLISPRTFFYIMRVMFRVNDLLVINLWDIIRRNIINNRVFLSRNNRNDSLIICLIYWSLLNIIKYWLAEQIRKYFNILQER